MSKRDPKHQLIVLALDAYDRAHDEWRSTAQRRASADASWSLRNELDGFANSDEKIKYDEKQHQKVIDAYDEDIAKLRENVQDARAALLLAINAG